jgi:hypothetical protein
VHMGGWVASAYPIPTRCGTPGAAPESPTGPWSVSIEPHHTPFGREREASHVVTPAGSSAP